MRRNSMILITFVSVLSLAAAACGGGDDDGGTVDAAPPAADAAPPTPDATPVVTNALGQACTPDQNNEQGDCPANHVCLALQGGSGPFCSKVCTGQADPVCNADYAGPGVGACVFAVTPQGGGTAVNYCAVVCEDSGAGLCNATTCDKTCPSPLVCSASLGSPEVAKACL